MNAMIIITAMSSTHLTCLTRKSGLPWPVMATCMKVICIQDAILADVLFAKWTRYIESMLF